MNKEFMRLMASLFIGLILGIAAMNIYISQEYEYICAKNKALERQVNDLTVDLEEMIERIEKQQKNKIINDIKVKVELAEEYELPTFEKTSVILDGENKLYNLLLALKGEKINNINYELIPKMVNGREFFSEGRRYILNTDVVVITDELHVYTTARLVEPN